MKNVFYVLALILSLEAHSADCIFGDYLFQEPGDLPRFDIQKGVIETLKQCRMKESRRLLLVRVDVAKDKITGRVYHFNSTHHDRYDGGNTLGWVEEVTDMDGGNGKGRVVAEIHDSSITDCRIFE